MNQKVRDAFFIVLNIWTIVGIIAFITALVAVIFTKIDPKLFFAMVVFVTIPSSISLAIEMSGFVDKMSKVLDKIADSEETK